eukprot:680806-Pelagomonas_calceolata.AAC.1
MSAPSKLTVTDEYTKAYLLLNEGRLRCSQISSAQANPCFHHFAVLECRVHLCSVQGCPPAEQSETL